MICCGSDLVGRMEGGLWAAFVWGVAEFGFFLFCFGVGGGGLIVWRRMFLWVEVFRLRRDFGLRWHVVEVSLSLGRGEGMDAILTDESSKLIFY